MNDRQIERQDCVDNMIFSFIGELIPRPVELEWDIYYIGEIHDLLETIICDELKLMEHEEFYPYENYKMTKDIFVTELEELVGCKIVGVVRSTDTVRQHYYCLKIDDASMELGLILWFLMDEEGNGPGSFTIEDYDTAEDFEEF